MITAENIIVRAMHLLGKLGESESLTAQEGQDGLAALNALIASLSLDKLYLYDQVRVNAKLLQDVNTLLIGPGGTIVSDRPIKIIRIIAIDPINSSEHILHQLEKTAYEAIPYKLIPAVKPTYYYYEPSYPNGTLFVYPVQNQDINIKIDIQTILKVYTLTQSLDLPPGYERALIYTLAIELAPEYGVAIHPALAMSAAVAVDKLKAVNLELPIMDLQFYSRGNTFDYRTG